MRAVMASLLATMMLPAVALAAEPPAQTTAASTFTVEGSTIGDLLDDPAAKAVLAKHIPAMIANDQIEMARSMTLKQIQGFAGDMLSDEVLAKVDADLKQLPAKR